MMKKRIPLRMCVICRQQFPKRELIRLVNTAEGGVEVDESGKKPGRGLYVCKSPDCLQQAVKGNRLEKSARGKINEEALVHLKKEVGHEPGS